MKRDQVRAEAAALIADIVDNGVAAGQVATRGEALGWSDDETRRVEETIGDRVAGLLDRAPALEREP